MQLNEDFDGGSEITLRHTDVAKSNSVLKKLGGIYDEHAKLVFLFDCSGSMNSQVAGDPLALIAGHEEPIRIDLVKRLAKQELENRFKKYPNSKISVIPFGDRPVVLFDDGDPKDLWSALDRLKTCFSLDGTYEQSTGGGTNILGAIRKAIDVCRAKPSPVGLHHFIIVSDGEDYHANNTIGSWVPALKASGVVMDYIHVGCESANDGLKAACLALGGEFVTVNSERDFETQFKLAVARLMLPAPAVALPPA